MEIQITKEQVDAVIETIVRKELEGLEISDWYGDEYKFTTRSFRDYVEYRACAAANDYIKEKFGTMIDEEIAEVARYEALAAFLSKPVKITDGYRQSEYDSWSAYLLKQIHEHSLSDWNVRKAIRDRMRELGVDDG